MKKCTYCGLENPDEATQCTTCHTDLSTPISGTATPPRTKQAMPAAVRNVWERMTFRQFAVLFIRFQSFFFLATGIDDALYLPGHFALLREAGPGSAGSFERANIFWLVIGIAWHVAAFLVCMRYADKIAGWLVRDTIRKQPPNTALEPTATAPSDSTEK